jgi:serine/threonine protein kinase
MQTNSLNETPRILKSLRLRTASLVFGSFGRVLFTYNSDTGETMVVKQIPIVNLHYEDSKERLREIQREIEILCQLHHKHIVRDLGGIKST